MLVSEHGTGAGGRCREQAGGRTTSVLASWSRKEVKREGVEKEVTKETNYLQNMVDNVRFNIANIPPPSVGQPRNYWAVFRTRRGRA